MQTELNYDIVFDAQEHFRLLLDSMSRPGKINTFPATEIFPPEGLNRGAALTGFALLNPDATYFISGDNAENIAGYLLINTAAQQAEISTADYVFIPQGYFDETLSEARTGMPTYPEDSATFIIDCELISENASSQGSLRIYFKRARCKWGSYRVCKWHQPGFAGFCKGAKFGISIGLRPHYYRCL